MKNTKPLIMNLLKSLAVALLLTAFTIKLSFAHSVDNPKSDLREQVIQLLGHPKFENPVEERVRISFFVTDDQELVVLKTDSRTPLIDQYIKSRMNYYHVAVEDLASNCVYHIKVHFIITS